jgi:hypothetical protein
MNADASVHHIYHRLRVSGLLYVGELNDGHSGWQNGSQMKRYLRSNFSGYTSRMKKTWGYLPLVIIPRVPSAPMNNFVVSNPAEDFRDLLRVLITSPDGSTTVYV